MSTEINADFIVGMAIATTVFRLGYTNEVTFSDLYKDNAWDEIKGLVENWYMTGTGVKHDPIDMYTISQSLWGMESDEVDAAIAELEEV